LNTASNPTNTCREDSSSEARNYSARNRSKAEIYVKPRNGKQVLFKDYSGRNVLTRIFYGRLTLRREAAAYERLKEVPGIPRCFGLDGKDVLSLEYIEGQPLSVYEYGQVPEAVFFKLEKIITAIHAQGVVNGDIHKSNVLITPDGEVYLIDFASAVFENGTPKFFYRGLRKLDRYAFERMKARYLCKAVPGPKGIFGVLYTTCITVKKIKRIKRINRIIRRMFSP